MENNRNSAITKRESYFFTGKPCKRGHISKRYTLNGACNECLHPTFVSVETIKKREIQSANKIARSERARARRQMKKGRFRIYARHFDRFANIVWGSSLLRCPALRLEDVKTRVRPVRLKPGQFFEVFWIFREDEDALHQVERELEAEAIDVSLSVPAAPAGEAEFWPEGDPT